MSKEMNLAGGTSYMLTDEEAKSVIEQMLNGGKNSIFIQRLGMAVNIASVMSVADPQTIPYFWGMKMNEAMIKVLRDGEWIDFAGFGKEEYMKQIEYRLKSDPSVIVEKNKLVKYEE